MSNSEDSLIPYNDVIILDQRRGISKRRHIYPPEYRELVAMLGREPTTKELEEIIKSKGK